MATPDFTKKLEQFVDSTRQDVRFALRQIARRPGFSALVAALVSGVAPALLASRTEIGGVLRESLLGRGGSRARNRLLDALVAAQIAIGLVLVNAAVLLMASYSNVVSQELNFDTDEVLVAGISLSGPSYEEPYQRREFYEILLDRVRNLPGVATAGLANKLKMFRHFLIRAARLFGPGLILGLLGTFAASTLTRNMVFGVSALNPVYVAAAVGAMILVAFAAIAVPVFRATRVNPVEALKVE